MPKKRLSSELWKVKREIVWERDQHKCTHCHCDIQLDKCNIDHNRSGRLGTNSINNLRTLCKRCHVLRNDYRHRGMIANALKENIIPPNWREFIWED